MVGNAIYIDFFGLHMVDSFFSLAWSDSCFFSYIGSCFGNESFDFLVGSVFDIFVGSVFDFCTGISCSFSSGFSGSLSGQTFFPHRFRRFFLLYGQCGQWGHRQITFGLLCASPQQQQQQIHENIE